MSRRKPIRAASPSLTEPSVACSLCASRRSCWPSGLSDGEIDRLQRLVSEPVSVPQGGHLYRRGAPFEAIYGVSTGFLKTCTTLENGREHVNGFHMAGELLGLEGIGLGQHTSDAVALQDSKVCVMPYARLELLARELPQVQRHLNQVMGREIVRSHGVMLLLASMRSDVRVAAFLLDLANRLRLLGRSGTVLRLCMTREEIGTHLGLTIETVSRCLSKFGELGVLKVRNRDIELLDLPALERLIGTVSVPASAGGTAHDAVCCDTVSPL